MPKLRDVLRSPLIVSVGTCAVVVLAVVGLRYAGGLETLELAAYDWILKLQPKAGNLHPHLVLITITEDDIRNQGQWPVSDATLARTLEILTEAQARAIGVDLFRDIPVPPGGDQLEAVLRSNAHIITVLKFGEGGVPAPKAAGTPDRAAFNDILVDPDGTVRRGLLFLDDGEKVFSSLALKVALVKLQDYGIVPQSDIYQSEYLRLGPTTIPPLEPEDGCYVRADPRGYQFLIDFKDAPVAFSSYSLTALLSGDIDPGAIKGKIVLIGITAESVKDFFHTPSHWNLKPEQMISGITLHAHMVSQILRWSLGESLPISAAGGRFALFWVMLWAFGGGALGLWVRNPWQFTMASLGSILVLGVAVYLACLNAWWLPLVPPALAGVLSATLVKAYVSYNEGKQRAILMQLFSRHVSPRIAELIWQEREQFMDGGRPRSQLLTATVLFSDLEGFTPATEKLPPQALTDWLNAYMEGIAQVIMNHDGIVDDYAGDGIKADFGVPLARTTHSAIEEDAVNAVNCALAMGEEIRRISESWQAQGLPRARLRIGINTGVVVAGIFGNARRLKYTTIGDTVNTASRLESYDKNSFDLESETLCRTLISETTRQYVGEHFAAKQIGEVMLKGKSQPVGVYRVLGTRGGKSGNGPHGGPV